MANHFFIDSELKSIRRWPTARAKEWVQAYVHEAASDPLVVAVLAVGSAVRQGVPSTDMDLLSIVTDLTKTRRERPPLEVDFRSYPAGSVESEIRRGQDYLGWAAKFGVLLHEKDGFWSNLLSRINGRIPLPSWANALERARVAHQHAKDILAAGDDEGALEQITSLLTHLARAALIQAAVYPASRPELPGQLMAAGNLQLSRLLSMALDKITAPDKLLREIEPEMHRLMDEQAATLVARDKNAGDGYQARTDINSPQT